MKNISEKMLVLENKIIDVLTIVTWWTEVGFDMDNIHWARIFSIVNTLLFGLSFLLELPIISDKKQYVWFWVFLICGLVFILFFLVLVTFREFTLRLLKYSSPQGSPNPCRISKKHSMIRRSLILMLIITNPFFDATLSIFTVYFFVATFFFCLCEFVLACDSIPPHEKSRRKATNELKDMNLARISN